MQNRNSLVTGDWHLTDAPLDEYRWSIFDPLREIINQYQIDDLFVLGDIVDRKDRHSGKLVNQLLDNFESLKTDTGIEIIVTGGNHDAPNTGPYYWSFLNYAGVRYIKDPTLYNGIYLLPFSPDPMTDWQDLKLHEASALFIHQTVDGAMVEGNRTIKGMKYEMPILPRSIPIFSGDVHRPQSVGSIVYIGAPYPVRFSEDWKCRVIVIENNDFKNYKEVSTPHIRRSIVDIKSAADLNGQHFKTGDQVRIRYHLQKDKLADWAGEEEAIYKWAVSNNVMIVSLESPLEDVVNANQQKEVQALELLKPEEIIQEFCKAQKLDELTRDVGIELLRGIE